MSTEKQEGSISHEELEKVVAVTAKKTLFDVRLLLSIGVGSIISIFVGGWAAYAQVTDIAEKKVDGGTAAMKQQVDDLSKKFDQHQADSGQVHRELKEDLHEVQMDLRALYKAVMTGERQPRLEKPVDGGP